MFDFLHINEIEVGVIFLYGFEEVNWKMNLKQTIQKMKQDSVTYHDSIMEYIRTVQGIFSACVFVFFILHIIVRCVLDFKIFHALNPAIWISILQMFLSLGWYFLFKYYLPVHTKYVLHAAYLNIFIIMALLELQYFLYDEFISYTIIICLILSTSLTIIGHIRGYMSIVTLIVTLDAINTVTSNYQTVYTVANNCRIVDIYSIYIYIVDNFFLILFVVGINFFFSKLKCQEFAKKQQILYLSERDGLTGLLNRRALEYGVETHANDDVPCAMILLDLDNFKALNDTLGHDAGDACLRAVAKELKELFTDTDYVSRLGGDEFIIFMPQIPDESYTREKVEMLLKKIPRQYPYDGGEICVTCSIGVVVSQPNGTALYEGLYKCADIAMYASKAKGKNAMTVYSQTLEAARA